MNYFVVAKTKDDHLHIRLKPSVKEDLKTLAELRGMTMSGLVYSMIVRAIREEKMQFPALFAAHVGFINFNRACQKRTVKRGGLACVSQSVKHEPRRFLRYVNVFAKLNT